MKNKASIWSQKESLGTIQIFCFSFSVDLVCEIEIYVLPLLQQLNCCIPEYKLCVCMFVW